MLPETRNGADANVVLDANARGLRAEAARRCQITEPAMIVKMAKAERIMRRSVSGDVYALGTRSSVAQC